MADNIKTRISLEGGEAVKKQLDDIGAAGKKAFGGLKDAAQSSGVVGNFTKGFDELKSKLGDIGGSFISLGNAAAGVGVKIAEILGVAGALSAGGFVALAISAARNIDEQVKLAETLGLTTKQLSGLQFAARQSGVDTDTLNTALTRLARSMEKTQQSGKEYAKRLGDIAIQQQRAFEDSLPGLKNPFLDQLKQQRRAIEDLDRQRALSATTLEKLGVAETDAAGNLRNEHDVLLDLADAFVTLPEGPKKAALALDIFGKGAARMVPFLNQGRAGIIAFEKEAQRVAPSLGHDAQEQATKLTDTFETFEKALGSLKNAAVAPFFAPLTDVFKGLIEVLIASREGVVGFAKDVAEAIGPTLKSLVEGTNANFNALRENVAGLGRDFLGLAESILGLIPSFQEVQQFKFSDVIKEISDAVKGLRIGFQVLKNTTVEINKDTGFFEFKLGGLTKAVEDLKSADTQAGKLNLGLSKVVGTADEVGKAFNKVGSTALTGGADNLTKSFVAAGSRIITIGENSADNFSNSFINAGSRVITFGQQTADAVSKSFISAGSRVISFGQQTADEVSKAFGSITALPISPPRFQPIADAAAQSGADVVTTFQNTGLQIVGAFDQAVTHITDSANQIADPFTRATDSVEQSFQQLGDSVSQQFDSIVNDARDAGNAIDDALSGVGGGGGGGGGSGFARGGPVRGPGTSTSDHIRAWLSNGEYVQPTRAVNFYGLPFMEAIRRLQIPLSALRERFSGGGFASSLGSLMPPPLRLATGGLATKSGGNVAHFHLFGETVTAMLDDDMMDRMQRIAIKQQLHSNGRKPSYFGR